jgi:hypothetical protein
VRLSQPYTATATLSIAVERWRKRKVKKKTGGGNVDGSAQNTDKELWREIEDDFYSPSIHVTADGKIGINVGGMVYVKTLRNWHELANDGVEWTKSIPE